MSRARQRFIVCLWLGLFTPVTSFAEQTAAADRWLRESESTAAATNASGVYGSYSLARIALEQARVYASRGDVPSTEARLPDLKRSRPEWSSDGGGMVRMISFTQDMNEVRQSLLSALAKNGRIDEAFNYTRERLALLPRSEGWHWLGHALAGQIAPADERIGSLESAARQSFDLGMLRAALAGDDDATTRAILARWPSGRARGKAISSLTADLMLDNKIASIDNLLRVAITDNPDSSQLLMLAASNALQNKDLDAAMNYAARMPLSRERDKLEATTALLLLQAERREDASRLFDNASQPTAKRWEQVALTLGRFEWLQSYYLAVSNPWRRAERFYQLARHALRDGDTKLAVHLAETAEGISGSIKTLSTRWIVLGAVAAIHATSGDIARATRIAARIPYDNRQGARHRAEAESAIAAAWARSGNANKAIASARTIVNPLARAIALAKAATSAKQHASDRYAELVEAARVACREVPATPYKSRENAWSALLREQLGADDTAGAHASAQAAQQAGAGATAWEMLVGHYISSKHFAAAQRAVQAIPSDVDPTVGYDRRERAQVELIEAMANSGEARNAVTLLASLTHKYNRQRATAAIAESLASKGEYDEALLLLAQVRRDDLREAGTLAVLRATLVDTQLPDPRKVMALVPERRAAALCWVVAAASAHARPVAVIDEWLAALSGPLCKSFAYAGAAWSVSVPAQSIKVHELLDRVDPRKLMQRLQRSMRARRGG